MPLGRSERVLSKVRMAQKPPAPGHEGPSNNDAHGNVVRRRIILKHRDETMKTRLLLIAGSIIGLALPAVAQEQNAVDPEVRQQIEAAHMKFDEAYNRSDAAGCTADYTPDAIEVWSWETAGGAAISQHFQSETKYAQSRNSSIRPERRATASQFMFVSLMNGRSA